MILVVNTTIPVFIMKMVMRRITIMEVIVIEPAGGGYCERGRESGARSVEVNLHGLLVAPWSRDLRKS